MERQVRFTLNLNPASDGEEETISETGRIRRRRWQSDAGRESTDSVTAFPIRRSTSENSLISQDPAFRLTEQLQSDGEPIVEIHADPSRICLATCYGEEDDDGIMAFLTKHHLTKDSLIITRSSTLTDPSQADLLATPKTPLGPSPSIRSLGIEESSSSTLTAPTPPPSPPPPTAAKTSLRRSFTTTVSSGVSLATGHALDQLSGWLETPETLEDTKSFEKKAKERSAEPAIVRLRSLKTPNTHLISPLSAPPEVLAQLPPLYVLAGQMDPILDDTIAFAQKAKRSGAAVVRVELLDGLPHGFLNFTLPSPECRQGAKRVLRRIRHVLFPELHQTRSITPT